MAERKWTEADIRMLIKLRGVDFKQQFNGKSRNNQAAWELIKEQLHYHYDVKAISKKWSNLVQMYKTLKDLQKKQFTENEANMAVTWPYYEAMDEALRSSDLNQLTTISSSTSQPSSPGPSSPWVASPAPSVASQSPITRLRYCGRIRTMTKERKKDLYFKKILLKQNNKMLRLVNSCVVLMGGKGLTGEIEVPIDDSSSDE